MPSYLVTINSTSCTLFLTKDMLIYLNAIKFKFDYWDISIFYCLQERMKKVYFMEISAQLLSCSIVHSIGSLHMQQFSPWVHVMHVLKAPGNHFQCSGTGKGQLFGKLQPCRQHDQYCGRDIGEYESSFVT